MKVLHVADFLPDTHSRLGGAEYVARRVIDEQCANGIDVEIATLQPDRTTTGSLPWAKHHFIRNLDQYAKRPAYAIKQLFLPGDPLARRDLRSVIQESNPDCVHFHNLHFSGMSVVAEAKVAKIPSVWSIYDYWIFCPSFMLVTNKAQLCTDGHGAHCADCIGTSRMKTLKPIKKHLFSLRPGVIQKYTDCVDSFVVLSEASKSLLVHHGIDPQRVSVIPQYIWKEAAEKPRTAQPERGKLTYVGWVEHRKGLHVIIEALGELAADYPELRLDILGMPANTAYERQLISRITELGIRKRINFVGKVSRDELLRHIHDSWIVTVPEQWENMSPVILTEAMAAGACVLGSKIGGIEYFIEDLKSGLLAKHDSAAEFAAKIKWSLDHQDQMVAICDSAKKRAMDLFNGKKINQSMFSLYSRLTQEALV